MHNSLIRILAVLFLLSLTACGGGGGGGSAAPPASSLVVSGVASKGILSGSVVSAYRVDNGQRGAKLADSQPTGADGRYSLTIPGGYSGVLLLETTGGTYTDEATGTTTTLSTPLRSALPVASGATAATLAVTPLTEVAVQKMGGNFASSTVTAANALIGTLFLGGKDIVATLPADVTNPGTATADQKNYALILASVAQKMKTDGSTLASALSSLASAVDSTNQTLTTPSVITAPLAEYLSTGTTNGTGISNITDTALVRIVTRATVKLSIPPLPANTSISGIDLSIRLPQGVTPEVLSGNDASGSAVLSGTAVGGISGASYDAGTRTLQFGSITASTTFAAGEFLTINCSVSPNAAVSSAGFVITAATAYDNSLQAIGAVSPSTMPVTVIFR